MIVSVEITSQPFYAVSMRFTPEAEAELLPRGGKATFEKLQELPVITELLPQSRVSSVSAIHPDLIALAALLVCGQLQISSLKLPAMPSSLMAQVALQRFKITLEGAGEPASVRAAGRTPGLAFSGGVDSCAALLALPDSTVSVFMRRFRLDGESSGLYNDSAALTSVESLQRCGFRAAILRSSVETVRAPIGFPVDWSNSLPLVLNAGTLDLGSISFGTVLESASSLGKEKFSDLSKRTIYSRWAPVFSAAGLPLTLPVAGLSEVLTSGVVLERGGFMRPQSCVRGEPGVPCSRCFKCFRKSLTESALNGGTIDAEKLVENISTREVGARLRAVPIHHEIGLAWAVTHVRSDLPVVSALRQRADAIADGAGGLDFLEHPYWPNVEAYTEEPLRSFVADRFVEFFGARDGANSANVESWNVGNFIESPKFTEGVRALHAELDSLGEG